MAGACSAVEQDESSEPGPQSADGTGEAADDSSEAGEGTDADSEDGSSRAAPGGPPAVDQPSLTESELALRLAELPGRLAIGNGPELAVARPDGARVEVIDGSESVVAAQPTWSADGDRLAWASLSADGQQVLVQDFGDDGVRDGAPAQSVADGNPVFYLQWNDRSDRLAYIRNAPGGGSVEVGVARPGSPLDPVGEGVPFYLSWAPEGDRLLGHVNDLSIDLYDASVADERGFVSIRPVSGGFSAPDWLDDGRALVMVDGALVALDVTTGDIETITVIGGAVRFVLSPDRRLVAFRRLGGGGGAAAAEVAMAPVAEPVLLGRQSAGREAPWPVQSADDGGLVVLDLETMEQVTVTTDTTLAWEWRPDSGGLAWLGAEMDGGAPIGTWNFWTVDEEPSPTERTPPFGLARKHIQAYLPFFAQYTQSVTGWSPDSSAFAFAGRIADDQGVWVQLTDERVAPRRVSAGDFVTWGPGSPPPPSNAASAA